MDVSNLGEYLVIFYRRDRKTGAPTHMWSDVVSRQQIKELSHWAAGAQPPFGLDIGPERDFMTVVHSVCKL